MSVVGIQAEVEKQEDHLDIVAGYFHLQQPVAVAVVGLKALWMFMCVGAHKLQIDECHRSFW